MSKVKSVDLPQNESDLDANISRSVPETLTGKKRSLEANDSYPDAKRQKLSSKQDNEESSEEKSENNNENNNEENEAKNGIVVANDISLDLKQSHLWTENDVIVWLKNLYEYKPSKDNSESISAEQAQSYAQLIKDNGVDGRVLLEFKGIKKLAAIIGIRQTHQSAFIAAVNDLRLVRMKSLGIEQ